MRGRLRPGRALLLLFPLAFVSIPPTFASHLCDPNAPVQVYERANSGGRTRVVSGEVSDLGSDFADIASSIRMTSGGCSGAAEDPGIRIVETPGPAPKPPGSDVVRYCA